MSRRSVILDIIRGIAALLVMLFHYTCAYNRHAGDDIYTTSWEWSVWWGYAAVATFFVLSGYLAGVSLAARERPKPWRYLAKRARRFYPAFWISMTVSSLVLLIWYRQEAPDLVQYFVNLTMISRLFGVPFIDGVYWSMQCELLFCLICAGLLTIRRTDTMVKVLAAWLIVTIALSFTGSIKALKFLRIITISEYSHDFAGGIILYMVTKDIVKRSTAAWMLVLCLLNSILWHGILTPGTIFFVITAVLIALLTRLDAIVPAGNPAVKAIVWVASISYPLYLVHEMIGFTIIRRLQAAGWTHQLTLLIPIAASLAIALIITRVVSLIERRRELKN